jgi:hypothetical protein
MSKKIVNKLLTVVASEERKLDGLRAGMDNPFCGL